MERRGSDAAEESVVLADLWDDEDELTVVRAPAGIRHQSGVIPLVDDRSEAILEAAPPSTARTAPVSDEASHVRSRDAGEHHEPIGPGSFASGTVVMDVLPPTPSEKLGRRTLRVSREELFANSAPIDWRDEAPRAEVAVAEVVLDAPRAARVAEGAEPARLPEAAERFVEELSQTEPKPLPYVAPSPHTGELPAGPGPALPGEPLLLPASGRLRRRAIEARARVAAVFCLLVCAATAVAAVQLGWL